MLNATLVALISSEGWAVAGLAVTGFFSCLTAVVGVWGQIAASRREVKLDEVKTIVNGDRAAKEAHNLALQAQLRAHGIDPVIAKAVPKE